MRYIQAIDGEWIRPKMRGYRMRCCDCSLVHVVDFRIVGMKVEMRPRRDKLKTAASRRNKQRALRR